MTTTPTIRPPRRRPRAPRLLPRLAAATAAVALALPLAAQAAPAPAAVHAAPAQRQSILVVDDNADAAATTDKKAPKEHSAESLECSKQADAKGLHGKERKKFRSECIKTAKGGAMPAPAPAADKK